MKTGVAVVVALLLAASGPGSAQTETYRGSLSCAKLPFTRAPLDNEPVELAISGGAVTYLRTLYLGIRPKSAWRIRLTPPSPFRAASSTVIPGRPEGPGPESIFADFAVTDKQGYGFRLSRFALGRNDGGLTPPSPSRAI